MQKRLLPLVVLLSALILSLPSCKSCKKEEPAQTVNTDTASVQTPVHTINLPHADSIFIPILSKVLDDAFGASLKKDYAQLGKFIIYRGPDSAKAGYDVFDARNGFDKKVLKVTADVFNKWNKDTESVEYSRVFEMNRGDGTALPVMEVIFVTKKSINRKFFIFQSIGEDWKIAEVTSYL